MVTCGDSIKLFNAHLLFKKLKAYAAGGHFKRLAFFLHYFCMAAFKWDLKPRSKGLYKFVFFL